MIHWRGEELLDITSEQFLAVTHDRGRVNDCMMLPDQSLAEFRVAVDRARWLTSESTEHDRIDLEQDICLASRSAYFDVYTVGTIDGIVDANAERMLNCMFDQALTVMQDGKWKCIIEDRREEFQDFCKLKRYQAEIESEWANRNERYDDLSDMWEFSCPDPSSKLLHG